MRCVNMGIIIWHLYVFIRGLWLLVVLAFDDSGPCRGREQPSQHPNRRRFSRPVMPQQRSDLTRVHGEIQPIYRSFDAGRGLKFFVQIDNIDTFVVLNLTGEIVRDRFHGLHLVVACFRSIWACGHSVAWERGGGG